jgi:hypothetical protein
MELMLVAAGAILLPLDALRVETLVLHGEVVAILTLAAGENDLVSGHGELPGKRDAGNGKRKPDAQSVSRFPFPQVPWVKLQS